MTTTIEPAEDTPEDTAAAGPEPEPGPSTTRVVLSLALAVCVLLAAAAVVVFVLVNDPPPRPVPVAEAAAPAAVTPLASATPEERFLAAWHDAQPGVAARQSDDFWARVGTSTCNLIGRPFITETMVVRVLGSNPQLMSADEGRAFLEVARVELCPQNEYAPELQWPSAGPVPRVDLPDFGSVTVPRAGSASIPTRTVTVPSVRAPSIPGSGSSGGNSGGSSSGGGSSSEPSIRPFPGNSLQPQPVN